MEALVFPTGRDWHELNRNLRHELDYGGFHSFSFTDQHGESDLCPGLAGSVALGVRRRSDGGLLDHFVLDVSAKTFLENLIAVDQSSALTVDSPAWARVGARPTRSNS